MQITGILKVKGQTTRVSEKFTKREFVLTDNSNAEYPQHISLQLTQDKCALIDGAKIGDTLTAHINIRGREWISPQGEVKHFNTIEAWRIEKVSEGEEVSMTNDMDAPVKSSDDLPF